MTHGQALYLILVVGSFGVFMAALGLFTAQYKPRPRTLPAAASAAVHHEDHATVH